MSATPDPSTLLNNLYPDHPRLILRDDRLADLKRQAETDATLQSYVNQVVDYANKVLAKNPLKYDIPDGIRLLGVSRDCVDRVYSLGVAWRWTGDRRYLDAGVDAIVRASRFPDWNPSHFLDTAEMLHAVGLGYDWFFHDLAESQRETIRTGLIKNGLQVGVEAYGGEDLFEPRRGRRFGWWKDCDHNWNQVCNCGLVIGALAIAETDPEYAQKIIPQAVASLPKALKMYGPDGAWSEGPGYWGYATRYTAYGFTALRTALDKDFGLLDIEGISETGFAPIHTTGPTGLYLNYADSGERNARRPMFQVFWLADIFNREFLAGNEHDLIAEHRASAQHVVWYVPKPASAKDSRPLDKQFRGPVEVALMRSSWDDPDALFVGFKAGYNQANHAHLDLGNFELDALGVRWVRDLGSDYYNLPDYWDGKQGGLRWNYWRLGAFSHNVITIDENNQDALATSSMTKFVSECEIALAVVDLSEAYAESAEKVARGVRMVDGRRAVLVQDEISGGSGTVTWGVTTDADIEIVNESEARLAIDGRQLTARILSSNASFSKAEAPAAEPPAHGNEGIRRLEAAVNASGSTTIAVLFSPEWSNGATKSCEIKPLSDW